MTSATQTPGVQTGRTATPRKVRLTSRRLLIPGGRVIDGSKSRDHGNTGDLDVLRAGVIMGKVTASGKYAATILGVVASAYTSGGTSLTVSAAQATEIVRRVGSSGSLKCIGPPSAAGTVATTSVTYSAVNTSTGVITVTDLGVNKIAGSFVTAADGSEGPLALIDDGYGIKVTDEDAVSVDTQWPDPLIGGDLDSSQIVHWPTDTSLIAWVKDQLNSRNGSQFTFDDAF